MVMMKDEKGFTLIELLLVVVIIGLMLAVIVPRAWRANIDAKYGLVRQNCSELASFAQEWAEGQLLAQNESSSTATMDDYFATLIKTNTTAGAWTAGGAWLADQGSTTNWGISGAGGTVGNQGSTAGNIAILGRYASDNTTTDTVPETVVEGVIPPEKVLRNPFNEVNVFQSSNDPSANPVVGAIACAGIAETDASSNTWHYYAFLFQGTDSTGYAIDPAAGDGTSFYAGQASNSIAGMRNGIFMARLRP